MGRRLSVLGVLGLLGLFVVGCDESSDPAADASVVTDGATDARADAAVVDAAQDAQPDARPAPPVLRNAVDMADADLARRALEILGSPTVGERTYCGNCHSLSRSGLSYWKQGFDYATDVCLFDPEFQQEDSAYSMIDCFRERGGSYSPETLGIYAAAARLGWFEYLFEQGFESQWMLRFNDFLDDVAMPRGPHEPMSQGDFDIVAEWFSRSLPELDTYLPPVPGPASCEPYIDPALEGRLAPLKTEGWAARNREADVLMFGCAGAETPRDCLAEFPETEPSWAAIDGSVVRVLESHSYLSEYWTRSSVDGRYVAHGGGPDGDRFSTIIDLQSGSTIRVSAYYDPYFFPDNSGFMFQEDYPLVCEMSALSGSPTRISRTTPGCSFEDDIGLYEHVGASLDGGDLWAVAGYFVSDRGTELPAFDGSEDTALYFTRMINTGSGFETSEPIEVALPWEIDSVISTSTRFVMSRLGNETGQQLGFTLRRVAITERDGAYAIDTPRLATYCVRGGKPAFSLDDQFVAIHRPTSESTTDIFLVDLLTGVETRVTNMRPGERALYPHFRSDGWMYFLIRTEDPSGEHIAASDAMLVLTAEP